MMSAQTTLTGLLPWVVLIASLLSLPISLFLLSLYRQAVLRAMSQAAGREPVIAEKQPGTPAAAPELRIEMMEAVPSNPGGSESPEFLRAIAQPWRVAVVYFAGGTLYSVVMTIGYLASLGETGIVFARIALIFWTYLWTAVIAMSLIVPMIRTRRFQLFASYFAVLFGIMMYAVARSPTVTFGSLVVYWLIINGPATVLTQLFLTRPIRAVGPLVLAFMILVGVGSQVIVYVAERNEGVLRAIAEVGFRLGLGAYAIFFGMIVLGMLIFAALGWPLLKVLGRRYQRKKMSEQSVILDSLLLVFALVHAIPMAFNGSLWILTGLVSFAGYKLVVVIGLALLRRSRDAFAPRTLLLLRVFALGKRSERFFRTIRRHWPYVGSISMIAGPDLVTTTVEPHEFMEFVSGRLSRQFIASDSDLSAKIATMDTQPDTDGRYRVHEFFCRRDTWQEAMERLATRSDMVLMDLRSFGPDNRGCVFEIERLLARVDLERLIFIIDPTTNRAFLESTIHDLWRATDPQAPSLRARNPIVRLLEVITQDEREMRTLLRGLLPGTAATSDARLRTAIATKLSRGIEAPSEIPKALSTRR